MIATVLLGHQDTRADHSVQVYRTAVAQRATMTLRDGSRVTLAPGTTLRVGAAFGADERAVTLQGQALFDVRDNTAAPFVVRTDGADIRVLGTTFAVEHYAGRPGTTVAVASGRVNVRRTGYSGVTTVAAGAIARVLDSTVVVSRGDDVTPYTAWASGRFVFDDAPLPHVLERLGRWYGVRFQLAARDSAALANRHVTVSFDERSLDDALGTLKLLMQLELAYDGRIVVVRRGARKAPADGVRERIVPNRQTLTNEVGR